MDPVSRRIVWKIIKKNKKGKAIFLSTHYMDEADILTDRKLILNKGVIRCLGSSMFLKKHFNIKYHLNIKGSDYNYIYEMVKTYIPTIDKNSYYEKKNIEKKTLENRIDEDNIYMFEIPNQYSYQLSNLISKLEEIKQFNHSIISNISVFLPSLEELFIKISLDNNSINNEISNYENINQPTNIFKNLNVDELKNKNSISPLIKNDIQIQNNDISQFKPSKKNIILSLIKFRFKIYLGNVNYLLISVFLPILLSLLFFLAIKNINKNQYHEDPPMSISFKNMYKNFSWNYDIEQSNNLNRIHLENYIKTNFTTYNIKYLDDKEKINNNENRIYSFSMAGNCSNNDNYNFNIYINKTMPYVPSIVLNGISNSILKSYNIDEEIGLSVQPFSYIDTNVVNIFNFYVCIFLGVILSFSLNGYGTLAVRERSKGLKNLLGLNQVDGKCYWISALIVDFLLYFTSCLTILFIGYIFHYDPLCHFLSFITIIFITFFGK